MSFATTFRNTVLATSLLAGSAAALSAAETDPADLATVLNAPSASTEQKQALSRLLEAKGINTESSGYAFDVTQRCKKRGEVTLKSFVECAKGERSYDRNINLALVLLVGVSISGVGILGFSALSDALKKNKELGLGTMRRPFE